MVLFPHLVPLPFFGYVPVVLAICWWYLRMNKQTFSDIGFRFADFRWRALLLGGGIGVAYAFFLCAVLGPLILRVTGWPPADVSAFYYIRHNTMGFIILLTVASLVAIPYEEIIFRGFIFTRIREMLPAGKWNFACSGLLTSILFAFYHIQEGASAVLTIFIGALFITWLYRIFKGNLWYLIFFHITSDIFLFTAIRMGYL